MDKAKTLDELLKMNGVVTAFEFALDGKLVAHKAHASVPAEQAGMTAQFCATITQLFNTLGGAYTKLSGADWTPQHGWAYSGGKFSVCIGGTRGVYVETARADYNRLFEALIGARPA